MKIYHELKETQKEVKGLVRMTQAQETSPVGEDVLILEQGDVKCYIPRSAIDLRAVKHSLIFYVGKEVSFVITEVNEAEGYVVGSMAIVKQRAHDALHEDFAQNPEKEVEAVVSHVTRYGAYLLIDGVSVLMRNQDFSVDYTNISDILKTGDKLMVRPAKLTPTKIIVEAIEKYCADTNISINDFSEGMVVLGRISTIKEAKLCFTSIAPNLDGLSPLPEFLEVEEGMRVSFRINQIKEDGRVRGRILRIIEESEEM